MKSERMGVFERDRKKPMMRTPSLVDLCVQTAIDNLRYLGDVGETDLHLLGRILPHCTLEQLKQVEDSTQGRDLSLVTDKLWKKFYETEFGAKSTNIVVERMKHKNVSFDWRRLYEAKMKDMEEAQQKSFDRIKQLYKKEDDRKQSRQVQLCTKVPPSSKRSFFGGWGPGSSIGNSKSSIMKKSKIDFLKSHEVKNLTALKRNTVQRNSSPVSIRKPSSGFSAKGAASTSRDIKPFQRRY